MLGQYTFAYRFNRRFDLRDLLTRLIVDTAVCIRPSHLDADDAEVQAAGFQRYGSSSAKAEAGCVGKRSRMSLRYA